MLKASLHATGACHWSVKAEWFEERGIPFRNQDRHVAKWVRPDPSPGEAAHVFRIVIPASELRPISQDEDLSAVTWIDEPPEQFAIEVELYLTPPYLQCPDTSKSPYRLLGALPLENRQWLLALWHQEPVTPSKARKLADARAGDWELTGEQLQECRGRRAVGFMQAEENPEGLIEFVL